ncbi:MAG: hypothetical protein ACI4JQ_08760 [Ruminococcus sp.]
MTKTVCISQAQRTGGWCEPVLGITLRPIPSELESESQPLAV